YAINRSLAVIGVSDAATAQLEFTALTSTSRAYEVADIVRKLVDALDRLRNPNALLLPAGVGLNVNIPDFAAGAGSALPSRMPHMGVATSTAPGFYEDRGQNPLAALVGIPAGAGLSGIGLVSGGAMLPSGVTLPVDDSPTSEANVIAAKAGVSVT